MVSVVHNVFYLTHGLGVDRPVGRSPFFVVGQSFLVFVGKFICLSCLSVGLSVCLVCVYQGPVPVAVRFIFRAIDRCAWSRVCVCLYTCVRCVDVCIDTRNCSLGKGSR